MPEEQAFCLLVKIMFDYGFRDLYRDGFEILHLCLYQLDKLIEVSQISLVSVDETAQESFFHFCRNTSRNFLLTLENLELNLTCTHLSGS